MSYEFGVENFRTELLIYLLKVYVYALKIQITEKLVQKLIISTI